MPTEANTYFLNSTALDAATTFASLPNSILVLFLKKNILKSSWLQGESYRSNKVGVAEVRLGKGRMVLISIRVQKRGQPHGTFMLLLEASLTSLAE